MGRGDHDFLQISPTVLRGEREGKGRASSAAVIYKYSFLSGLHNECRKLSGTINTYYISPDEVSGALLAAQKKKKKKIAEGMDLRI